MSTWHKYIPQHSLSRLMGWLANRRWGIFTTWAIKLFIRYYQVNMQEAEHEKASAYPSFNVFFTRHLKSTVRPVNPDSAAILAPVDGCISEIGVLQRNKILQAKNHFYTAKDLLGGDEALGKYFENGSFLTAYLAPRDYHRIHMPLTGRLMKMTYIPGQLFSVNTRSVELVPQLFARNERVVCLFETEIGLMAVILVGAMIVGSIHTQWHGKVAPGSSRAISVFTYDNKNIQLNRGAELGYFVLGSTVILLFPENKTKWDSIFQTKSVLRFGEKIGMINV